MKLSERMEEDTSIRVSRFSIDGCFYRWMLLMNIIFKNQSSPDLIWSDLSASRLSNGPGPVGESNVGSGRAGSGVGMCGRTTHIGSRCRRRCHRGHDQVIAISETCSIFTGEG